jgi:hypothetical protein
MQTEKQETDGRTDTHMTKLIDDFLNFANAPMSDKGEMMQALSETFVLHIANF